MPQNSHENEKILAQAQRDLCKAILSLETAEQCERFFTDLCTPSELRALADRWRVARLLDRAIPYREIYERTGVSTATVTRVARALTHGESGYRHVLNRLVTARSVPSNEKEIQEECQNE